MHYTEIFLYQKVFHIFMCSIECTNVQYQFHGSWHHGLLFIIQSLKDLCHFGPIVCFTFYLFVVKSVFCTQVLTAFHRTTYCTELSPLQFLNIQTTLFALFEMHRCCFSSSSHHTVYLQITKIVQ